MGKEKFKKIVELNWKNDRGSFYFASIGSLILILILVLPLWQWLIILGVEIFWYITWCLDARINAKVYWEKIK